MGTSKLSGLKILGWINVDEFDAPSGPMLPDRFDVATATPIKYFHLLFPERIFEILKNNTNRYAEFLQDQRRIDRGNHNWEDTKWCETSTDEMRARDDAAASPLVNR